MDSYATTTEASAGKIISVGSRATTDAEYIANRTELANNRLSTLLERLRGATPPLAIGGVAKAEPLPDGYFGALRGRLMTSRDNVDRLLAQIDELEGLFS